MAAAARPTVGVLSLAAIWAVPEPAVARDASIWEARHVRSARRPCGGLFDAAQPGRERTSTGWASGRGVPAKRHRGGHDPLEPALPVPGHRPPGLRPGSSLGSTRRIAPG
jgi:hypothetical protein